MRCPACGNPFEPKPGQRYCSQSCRWKARYLQTDDNPSVHVVIPDCQVKPGIPTEHLGWIGQYIVDQFEGHPNVKLIELGDFADMPSLSHWDRGKIQMEGRRYKADIHAANEAWAQLNEPILAAQSVSGWTPTAKHKLFGNHEHRIVRAAESNAELDGLLTLNDLETGDWERHAFLEPVWLDGICYSHYIQNRGTGRPLAGSNLEARVRQVGHSFTMGHQQGLKWARVETIERTHIGLAAGSCYLHEEDYLGLQGVNYWRGIVVCHQVESGEYDPMFVSLDYLSRRYAKRRLNLAA